MPLLWLALVSTIPADAPPAGASATRPPAAKPAASPAVSLTSETNVARNGRQVWPTAFANLSYRPIEKPEHPGNPRREVKGLYVTLYSATSRRLDDLIEIADQTDINAFVIDVKDDRGDLLFRTQAAVKFNPEANRKALLDDIRP